VPRRLGKSEEMDTISVPKSSQRYHQSRTWWPQVHGSTL